MKRGKLITFEGGEGTGKTTLIRRVEQWLGDRGIKVVTTREPGGVAIAEQIRDVILDPANTAMDARTEALLYAAARRQHLVEKIMPGLEAGCVVLCDRYIDSSLAYQGHARGLGIDEVERINRFAIGDVMPDLTILLDLDPTVGLERIQANKEREVNRLDMERVGFHGKVREGYRLVAGRYPERVRAADASLAPEEVFRQVVRHIEAVL